ncbi:MAG TPA: helix-turn-helix domain-containing protein [Candidatus Thermoplasmatota archaeon]|nr:helix-turn-helix domain-containing protein [Candidatus Thermoplasmatota archaeon]
MAKAAASRHSYELHEKDCPLSEPPVLASFDGSLAASKSFSGEVLKFLARRSPEAQTKWAQASVEAGRVIFQPWSMEIVFVLAIAREARFGQLQTMLGGISSRTLSDKLQTLRDEGLVEREVHDEQPVRIEYRLTKEGRMTAALATPLFAHLNHRKM